MLSEQLRKVHGLKCSVFKWSFHMLREANEQQRTWLNVAVSIYQSSPSCPAIWSIKFSLCFRDPIWLDIARHGMPRITSLTNHIIPCRLSVRGWTITQIWEMEDGSFESPSLSPEEKLVMNHFQSNHYCDETGWFIVPLPKKEGVKPLGESRGLAVMRFLSLENLYNWRANSRNLLRLCKNNLIWGMQSQCSGW